MKTNVEVIDPSGIIIKVEADFPERPDYREIAEFVRHHIGKDEEIERVRVFWDGKYTDMFVAECGKLALTTRGPLPLNPRATEIYLNNTRVHAPHLLDPDAPGIAGRAVLFDRPVWF